MGIFKSQFHPKGKTALIVGASQGVGADLASKLYELGCSVILVARTQAKLEEQVEHIKTTQGEIAGAELSYICCDATEYDKTSELWQEILTNRNLDPDFIFCCAGSSIPKLFDDLTPADLTSGISLNYSTALNVVHSGFKEVKKLHPNAKKTDFKQRHIVFFSSVVSFFPFIGYAQYAPMKAAVESLSIILRQELGPFNYRVSCVFPGNFQSDGFIEEQKTKPEITKIIEGPSNPIPSEECASIIIRKLEQGYDSITTDFIGWVLGCSVLGVLPREWGFLQVLVSLIFSIVEPIAMWVINRDIFKYFDKEYFGTTSSKSTEDLKED